ncbi:hypothetical protein LCGC14_0426860, partial [marine sediment metagenome]
SIATCFYYNTPVLLSNGKTEQIGRIVNQKKELEVVSYNLNLKKFENKKILNWIKLPGDDVVWYRMSYASANKTCSGDRKSVIVTGDHKILTNNGYKRVDEIKSEKIATRFLIPNSFGKLDIFYDDLVIDKLSLQEIDKYKDRMSNVYCLEIEDNHNFIVNDMLVSNCGLYYFQHGRYFVDAAEQMIKADDRTNGEFYTCPAFNYMIKDGKKVFNYPISQMLGTGTPEDLQHFISVQKQIKG